MKTKGFLFFLLWTSIAWSQIHYDTIPVELEKIVVIKSLPLTKQIMTSESIEKVNLGQDIPVLLSSATSVIWTSDTGSGIGYTGLRIRGSDQTRINVTIDDITINDSESHNVFWVNMPDLSSNIQSITIQRGLGTSVYGTGAFGGSLNIQSAKLSDIPEVEGNMGVGSFNTLKTNFRLASGLLFNNRLKAEGSISQINSAGYIDRASSDLQSYHLKSEINLNKTVFKLNVFGGREKTYQAWYGIDSETMKKHRTFNYAGAIYDEQGNITGYYDNQIDHYAQDHFHLKWEQYLTEKWQLKTALHWTYGRGYYEEYVQNQNLKDYFLTQNNQIADLVRRKWLDNDFYGIQSLLKYSTESSDFLFGLNLNRYDGSHYGRVISVKNQPIFYPHEYYNNLSQKDEFAVFAKYIWDINPKVAGQPWEFYLDAQYRYIHYQAKENLHNDLEGLVAFDKIYHFFNPKIGFNYKINTDKLFLSYALGHREPNRSDLLYNPEAVPEILSNFELGYALQHSRFQWNTNLFLMLYSNQLVLTGRLDEVGNPIRENVGKSYRSGIETELFYKPTHLFSIRANYTFSINKNLDWKDYINGEYIESRQTDIAYSPRHIGAILLESEPIKHFNIGLQNKFVGKQWLANNENSDSELEAYFLSDLYFNYIISFKPLKSFKISILINNLWNKTYISNGYFDGQTAYYYPQAGTNFLLGINIGF